MHLSKYLAHVGRHIIQIHQSEHKNFSEPYAQNYKHEDSDVCHFAQKTETAVFLRYQQSANHMVLIPKKMYPTVEVNIN
jgi:hypothetical protein